MTSLESKEMKVNFYTEGGKYKVQYVFSSFIGNSNFTTEEVTKENGNKIYLELLKDGMKKVG